MITIFAYITPNFYQLGEVTLPNIRKYRERHGYGFYLHDVQASNGDRPFGFAKMEAVLRLLKSLRYGEDAVFVMDLDILIMNHTIRLESFMDPEHDLFVTHDVNGFNAGAYLIRATLGMQKFLEDAIDRWGNPGVFGEQDAMRDSLRIGAFANLLKVLPQSSFNSYLNKEYPETLGREEGNFEKGDFILHLPGMGQEKRIKIFTSPEIQNAIVE